VYKRQVQTQTLVQQIVAVCTNHLPIEAQFQKVQRLSLEYQLLRRFGQATAQAQFRKDFGGIRIQPKLQGGGDDFVIWGSIILMPDELDAGHDRRRQLPWQLPWSREWISLRKDSRSLSGSPCLSTTVL